MAPDERLFLGVAFQDKQSILEGTEHVDTSVRPRRRIMPSLPLSEAIVGNQLV